MRKVISNTTPLLALADIGCFDLLEKLYGEVFIPQAVMEEVKSEPARNLVKSSGFIHVCTVSDNASRRLFSSRLHAGEVEVMLLAEEHKADLLLMDDNAAKRTAKFMGFKVTGTLGMLLRAKQDGHVRVVRPYLEKLQESGFFVSEKVCRYVLDEAGE